MNGKDIRRSRCRLSLKETGGSLTAVGFASQNLALVRALDQCLFAISIAKFVLRISARICIVSLWGRGNSPRQAGCSVSAQFGRWLEPRIRSLTTDALNQDPSWGLTFLMHVPEIDSRNACGGRLIDRMMGVRACACGETKPYR